MSDLIKLQKIASERSILYIDGDKALQKNYSIYFKKAFKNFYQAFDGEEGLLVFKKHKPEVVILNLELEKLDAIELISEITDIKEDIILISISEVCENYDLLQTLDMGLSKTLLKPVGFAKIANLLISLLPPPPKPKVVQKPKVIEKPTPIKKPVVKKIEEKEVIEKSQTLIKPVVKKEEIKKAEPIKKKESIKPLKEEVILVKKEVLKKEKLVEKEVKKVEPGPIKTDIEICMELIRDLEVNQTLVEFINSYKGVMVLHNGVIASTAKEDFTIKVNIAQILATKTEKQILIKTQKNQYIHAQLAGIDLQNTTIKLAKPRILEYKQRDKEFARILADKSFKASIYYKKKHIDFDVSYISFRSAVLVTKNLDIDIKPNSVIDITLGFNISGPNAMIKDKKFIKVFAKCEVIRVDEKIGQRHIVVLLEVSKAGERTLQKYLLERESEIIYEFKSRIRK